MTSSSAFCGEMRNYRRTTRTESRELTSDVIMTTPVALTGIKRLLFMYCTCIVILGCEIDWHISVPGCVYILPTACSGFVLTPRKNSRLFREFCPIIESSRVYLAPWRRDLLAPRLRMTDVFGHQMWRHRSLLLTLMYHTVRYKYNVWADCCYGHNWVLLSSFFLATNNVQSINVPLALGPHTGLTPESIKGSSS